jgi:hypothetical protein
VVTTLFCDVLTLLVDSSQVSRKKESLPPSLYIFFHCLESYPRLFWRDLHSEEYDHLAHYVDDDLPVWYRDFQIPTFSRVFCVLCGCLTLS